MGVSARLELGERHAEALRVVGDPPVVRPRVDRAGADRVDRDPQGGGFDRQRAGQSQQAVLARGIGSAVNGTGLAGGGRDLDDPTVPALDHRSHGVLAEEVGHGQVDIERLLPEVVIEVDDRPRIRAAPDPRIVHEDVNPSQRGHSCVEDGSGGTALGQVGDHRHTSSAGEFDLRLRRLPAPRGRGR